MANRNLKQLFNGNSTVEVLPILDLVDWFSQKVPEGGRLRLPPIQRSLIWSNEQILNYWDSLLRGYPAGMMMVHRMIPVLDDKSYGRNSDNHTERTFEDDLYLFDGQQRLATILLGLGAGALAATHRIWVDLGDLQSSDGRLFKLRINSTGQPFGYAQDLPNQKLELRLRRAAFEEWHKDSEQKSIPPNEIFDALAKQKTAPLVGAECAINLARILSSLKESGPETTCRWMEELPGAESTTVATFVDKLQTSFNVEIVLKLVPKSILDEENYVRFFTRLGQGGTKLSNDELIYSLIKNRYPHVHDRMQSIVNSAGRITSEVNLILAALRIAKNQAPWQDAKDWEKVVRPWPELIYRLRDERQIMKETEDYFLSLVPNHAPPNDGKERLLTALKNLREGLEYREKDNPAGLPNMLLARFPRQLLDVLLLFSIRRGEELPWENEQRSLLITFALHWLIFVGNDDKAGNLCFDTMSMNDWVLDLRAISTLIRRFEAEGIARHIPVEGDWRKLDEEIKGRKQRLATWSERFHSVDGADRKPGEALRIITTNRELVMRVLLWLQRSYVAQRFPDYDPVSTRDDDLPFDLDHVIPYKLFGADFRTVSPKLDLIAADLSAFRNNRGAIGNSLGNYRWLDASVNRGRGADLIEDEQAQVPLLCDEIDRCEWNPVIEARLLEGRWSKEDVAKFQRLIDKRSLHLVKKLVDESGIRCLST